MLLAVNKCESTTVGEALGSDFWGIGFGAPFPVSAISAGGIAELMAALDGTLAQSPGKGKGKGKGDANSNSNPSHANVNNTEDEDTSYTRVAIVGRPNVGKSRSVRESARFSKFSVQTFR